MSLEEQSQIAQSHIYSYLTTDTHRYLSEDATNKASPTVPHPSVAAVGLEDHGIAHAQEVHPADRNAENSVEPANDNTSRKPDERDVRDLRPLFPLQPEENLQVLPAGLTLENADPTPLPPPDPEISLEADGLHFSSDAIKHQGRSRSPVKDTIPTKRVVSETIAADNGVLETGLLNADRANQSGTFDGEPQVIDVLDNNPAAAPSSILDLADTTSGPKALETKDYDQASYRGLVHEHRRTESGDTSAVDASSRCCKSTASSRSDDCSGGTDFDHASTPNDTDATSLRSRCSQSPPGNDLSSEVILDINAGEGLNLGHQLALNDTLLPSSKPLLTPGEYTPAHASTAAGVDDQDFGNASTVWRRQDYSSPHLLPNTDVLAPVFLPQPPQSFAAQPGQPAAAVPIQVEDEWDSDSAFNEDSQSYTTSLKSSVTRYEYENGRRYHAADGDSWHFLPNDEPEHERLDLFHHVLHLRCDSRLHLAPICENPHRILDLGTGTGIWAIQMAEKYESASVLGNDLSPIQPDLVPPNLSFEVDDMEKEWCYNTPFDYIHCRYLAGALRDWPKLMQQAYKSEPPIILFSETELLIRS
ncbi:MAG: hypothetical protein M1820_002156 [Bogoriella megaspora]|nr:MAG: hypothetical protein M1820_002156 [Bogoriella megaspora]